MGPFREVRAREGRSLSAAAHALQLLNMKQGVRNASGRDGDSVSDRAAEEAESFNVDATSAVVN
jgi:hypothetical protein